MSFQAPIGPETPISFQTPMLLWGLLLVPLALLAYLLAQRRRSRYAVRFTNLDLLANVVQRTPGWRRHVPAFFYLLALSALLISLARPQAVIRVPREEATVLLVVDVSFSMDATDVKPTRLGAAQDAANTFLDQIPPGLRVGLVSFASTVQTLAPPTTDRGAVRAAVNSLQLGSGTAMGDGIKRALELGRGVRLDRPATPTPSPTPTPTPVASPIPEQSPLVLLLLSDGAQNVGQTKPLEAAADARLHGVPIFTIALGTADGTVDLPVRTGGMTRVPVPPDPETLKQIADMTGGRFFPAPSANALKAAYQNLGTRVGFVEQYDEVTVLFAAAGLVLLLIGGALSTWWFNRFP